MSRKWSPGAEVARDKLFDQLQFSGLSAGERWQMVDDFARELAEQQRAHTGRIAQTRNHAELALVMETQRELADLIDPYVGPASPGEEPTP